MKQQIKCLFLDANKIRSVVNKYVMARAEFDATTVKLMEQDYVDKMAMFFSGYSLEGLKELSTHQGQYRSLINSHTKVVKREMSKFDLSTKEGIKSLFDYVGRLESKGDNYRRALAKMRAQVDEFNRGEGDKAKAWGDFYSAIEKIADQVMKVGGAVGGKKGEIIAGSYSDIKELALLINEYNFKSTNDPGSADIVMLKIGAQMNHFLMNRVSEQIKDSKVKKVFDRYKDGKKALLDVVFKVVEDQKEKSPSA